MLRKFINSTGDVAKAFVKGRTTYSLRRSALALIEEARVSRRHHRSLRRARRWANATGLKLNVGCGANIKSGWVNIDLHSDEADLQLDVCEPLPFADNSVSVMYAEHFFEHIEYPLEVRKFLSEAKRVLVPGGMISIGIPDFELFVTSYVTRDQDFYRELFQYQQPEWVRETPMHVLNWIFRAYGHKYAYDFETLERVFDAAGFVNVVRRDFDRSLDSEARKWGTMYVDAQKPT